MELNYHMLVAFSKSWGLFYLMGFFVCVVVYAYWPRNRKRFERAKHSILEQDDRPWLK